MRLAWHIAKKDLRRMAGPVAVWLLLVLAAAIAFRAVSIHVVGHAASNIDMWRSAFSIWVGLFLGVQLVIGYVLAGSLVLEDALVGTTTFWATRPIASARLLAAKLLAAFMLFIVAPILVLTPVWLSAGFGLGDLAQAGWDFVTRFGASTLVALMAASLARNLAQFLLFTLLIVGAFVVASVVPTPLWRDAPMAVRATRQWIVLSAALPMCAGLLTHQFLTRRLARTWALVGAALLIAALIRCAWPWEMLRPSAYRAVAPRPDDHVAEVVAAPAFTQHSPKSLPTLYGKTEWHADGFLAPVCAHSLDEATAMRSAGSWEGEAGLRVLGFSAGTGPMRWQLHLAEWRPASRKSGQPEFDGLLEVWSVRPRILGEMPLRVGAEMQHGTGQVRILQLVFNEDRLDNIFVEERDTRAHHAVDWSDTWSKHERGQEAYIDRYFVVDRAIKKGTATSTAEIGAIESNSMVLRFRSLGLSWFRDPESAVLVKIRFERDHSFTIPLQVRGVSESVFDQHP